MGKSGLFAIMLVFLCGCTTLDPSPPEPNPSPQARFVILGRKDPSMEVHFKLNFMTHHEDCDEKRPLGGGNVVRLHTDKLSFAAGSEEFTAEFFLDRYLAGHCEWRPREIEVSVNRPPYGGIYASWQSIVWFDSLLGTPGLKEVLYVCKPPETKPNSKALSCTGPMAEVSAVGGQFRASFVLETS